MNVTEAYYNDLMILWGKITIGVAILPLLFGLFYWHRFNKPLKIYWWFLLIGIMPYFMEQFFVWSVNNYLEFWKPYLKQFNIESTNFLRILPQINNFALLGWFLSLVFRPNPLTGFVKGLSLLLVVVAMVNYLFIQGHNMAGGFNSTASALYCLLLPLAYMWYLYNQESKVHLVENPYFWISLGLIIPNLLGLFLYFAGDVLYRENFMLYAQFFLAKTGIEIIAQLLTVIGFHYAPKVKYLPST
jgi:hypothetical protein